MCHFYQHEPELTILLVYMKYASRGQMTKERFYARNEVVKEFVGSSSCMDLQFWDTNTRLFRRAYEHF